MPYNAALALSVSNIVSIRRISAPPSINPRACSLYALLTWSKLTALNPGSVTDGEIDKVLLVGPMAPATNLCIEESFLLNSLTQSFAIAAACRFNS